MTVEPQSLIDAFLNRGITTLRRIAGDLNERAMVTACGGPWHASSVALLLQRRD